MIELPQSASAVERQAALLRFLRNWYGELREGETWPRPDGCPALLAWWHSLVLANPGLAGMQNHFDAPELLAVDPFIRYRGNTVETQDPRHLWFFYTEHQGVVSWSCESGEDPVVWAKSDWPPGHSDSWSQEAERLSGFLIGAVMMEAMYGSEAGGAWTSMKRGDFEALAGLRKLSLEPSRPPNQRLEYWCAKDFIAVTASADFPDDISVMFGSRLPETLEHIGGLVEDPYGAGLWQ